MSADISNLANLQSGEILDWEGYVDAKEAQPPPRKGRYQARVTEKPTFGATNAGYLSAQIDPTLVGPTNEGYQVRFAKVSAKPFKRGAATVSQLGDFLRSVYGAAAPRVKSPQEQADAVEASASRIIQIDGDWEAYCKGCKTTVKGEAKFPKVEGVPSPWIPCPNGCKVEGSETEIVDLRARFKIDRYVAAS